VGNWNVRDSDLTAKTLPQQRLQIRRLFILANFPPSGILLPRQREFLRANEAKRTLWKQSTRLDRGQLRSVPHRLDLKKRTTATSLKKASTNIPLRAPRKRTSSISYIKICQTDMSNRAGLGELPTI